MGDNGEDRGYEQSEEAYTEGDDGTLEETYLVDPDMGFTEEDLLFAENAFAPHMMGRPVPTDGLEEPDVPESELDTDDATTDVYEAIDEGKIYYPPEDAPTQPSQRLRDVDIATGFATSANDAPPEEEDVPTSFEDSDWDIAQRVTEALRLHAYTSDMQIRVHVREGVVMLRGRVDNLQDAAVAEDIASEVEGVEEVREQLTVG
jgi:hypothetical protein